MLRRARELNLCYEDQLASDPDLEGRVEVSWRIEGGVVRSAEVVANSTGSDALASCIRGRVELWRFGADVSGPVSWPFTFRRK